MSPKGRPAVACDGPDICCELRGRDTRVLRILAEWSGRTWSVTGLPGGDFGRSAGRGRPRAGILVRPPPRSLYRPPGRPVPGTAASARHHPGRDRLEQREHLPDTQRPVLALLQRVPRPGHREPGIGICTGEVVVGNVGGPSRKQYTAIGDVVKSEPVPVHSITSPAAVPA